MIWILILVLLFWVCATQKGGGGILIFWTSGFHFVKVRSKSRSSLIVQTFYDFNSSSSTKHHILNKGHLSKFACEKWSLNTVPFICAVQLI